MKYGVPVPPSRKRHAQFVFWLVGSSVLEVGCCTQSPDVGEFFPQSPMQFSTPRPCSSCFVWWSSNTSLLHSNRRCVLFCFYGRLSEIEGKSLVLLTSLRKPFLGLLYHIRWMFRTSEVRWIHRNLMLSIRSNSSASMKSGVCSILLDLLLSIRTSLVLLGFRTRLLSENDPVRLNLLPVASLIIV